VEWDHRIEQANVLVRVSDNRQRIIDRNSVRDCFASHGFLLTGPQLMEKEQQRENGTGFLPFLLRQVEAIRWAVDWENVPAAGLWKTNYLTACFQAQNLQHFEDKPEEQKHAKMIELKQEFEKYKRTCKGRNAAKKQLLAMYRQVSVLH
jgi:hypothetical protein